MLTSLSGQQRLYLFVLSSGVLEDALDLFVPDFSISDFWITALIILSSVGWVGFAFVAFRRSDESGNYLIAYLSVLLVFTITSYAVAYKHTGLCDTHVGSDCSHVAPQTALYFSIITWTTVGYGDVTPNGDLARFAAAAEALTSYIGTGGFVGFLVARFSRR